MENTFTHLKGFHQLFGIEIKTSGLMRYVLLLALSVLTSCSVTGKYYLKDAYDNQVKETIVLELKTNKMASLYIADSLTVQFPYYVISRNKYGKLIKFDFTDMVSLQIKDTCAWVQNRIILGDNEGGNYYLLRMPPLSSDSPSLPPQKIKFLGESVINSININRESGE